MKTAELTGPALDWAVAKILGTLGARPGRCFDCKHFEERAGRDDAIYYCHHPKSEWGGSDDTTWFGEGLSPDYGVHQLCPITELTPEPYSTNWAQGGPIIEREDISIEYNRSEWPWIWTAYKIDRLYEDNPLGGNTPLVAAMRCLVASKLGDNIDIPKELS